MTVATRRSRKRSVILVEELGLQSGPNPTVNNAALLNAALLDARLKKYAYRFLGDVYLFTETVVVPSSGHLFLANGMAKMDALDTFYYRNGSPTKLCWAGGAVTFNGTTITASTSGASATITISGSTVKTSDFLHTLDIKPGGLWIAGRYHILVADPGTNTWTLDRVCSTATATSMIGVKKGTLWRDDGFGNCYRGLNFRGTPTPTNDLATHAAILWQQRPELAGVTPNTGKVSMRDCTFANADVGLLFGKGLAASALYDHVINGEFTESAASWSLAGGALYSGSNHNIYTTTGAGTATQNTFAPAGTYLLTYSVGGLTSGCTVTPSLGGTNGISRSVSGEYREEIVRGATADAPLTFTFGAAGAGYIDNINLHPLAVSNYDGNEDNNADWFLGDTLHFQGLAECDVLIRNEQSIGHDFRNIAHHAATKNGLVFYVERGGRMSVRNLVTTTGGSLSLIVLRVGNGGGATGGTASPPILFDLFLLDASVPATQLLVMDGTGDNDDMRIIFRDGVLGGYIGPLVTVKDGCVVTLDNIYPLQTNSVVLLDDDSITWKPAAIIVDNTLSSWPSVFDYTHPELVIDDDASTAGLEVNFRGNFARDHTPKFCREGVWSIGGGGPGRWKTSDQWPVVALSTFGAIGDLPLSGAHSILTNLGDVAPRTINLPTPAVDLKFRLHQIADQALTITTIGAPTIIGNGNTTANQVILNTPGGGASIELVGISTTQYLVIGSQGSLAYS